MRKCITLLLLFSAVKAHAGVSYDSSDFVVLNDYIPEAKYDIRYYSDYNFVGERIDGYEAPVALLTREAADALREVNEELAAQNLTLKIYDAYRPQRAVNHFIRWSGNKNAKMKKYFYPEKDKRVLFRSGYISRRSGHSRGSTVDLTLYDLSRDIDVDMGGTFDYFGERSHTNYKRLTKAQHNNRMLLRDIMQSHGFKGITTEWWHFTLRDEPYPDTYFDFPVKELK